MEQVYCNREMLHCFFADLSVYKLNTFQ